MFLITFNDNGIEENSQKNIFANFGEKIVTGYLSTVVKTQILSKNHLL